MATIAVIHDSAGATASDTAVRDFLVAAGHTVDLVAESGAAVSSATYDAAVISESGSSGEVSAYTSWPGGVVCFETPWDVLGLASTGASSGGSSTDIDLVGTHAINTGFADPLTIFGSAQSVYGVATTSLAASVDSVAVSGANSAHTVVAAADAGVTDPAAGRRVGFGLISDRPAALNTTGQDYVTAAVEWAANVSTVSEGNATGTHAWAGVATGTNRPATPTGLTATPVAADQIDLSWNAVTGATGYDIERDGVVVVTGHATTAYSDTGLAPATQYSYRVRAVN